MTDRNSMIDIARGMGVALVVLGHNPIVWQEKGDLYRLIYSFHMPLFFFLSGVFFNPDKNFLQMVSEKADALLKPYFVVLILVGIFGFLYKGYEPFGYVFGLIYATGPTIEWTPLWFLPHLFLVVVFSWLIVRFAGFVSGRGLVPLIACVLFLIGGYTIRVFWQKPVSLFGFNGVMPGLPWSADIVFVTSAYFLLGFCASVYVRSFSPRLPWFMLAVCIFLICNFLTDQAIDLNNRRLGGGFFLFWDPWGVFTSLW